MRHHFHRLNSKKLTALEMTVIFIASIEPIANIPQIYKIYSTKSAEDFFLWTYVMGITANIAWLIYGIKIKKVPVIWSAIVWMSIHVLMTAGIILYS